jgi:hypothetical protein
MDGCASPQSPDSINFPRTSRQDSDVERRSQLNSESAFNSKQALGYLVEALDLLLKVSVDHCSSRQLLALYVNVKTQLRALHLQIPALREDIESETFKFSPEVIAWMKCRMPNEYTRWLCDQAVQKQQQATSESDLDVQKLLLGEADELLSEAYEQRKGLLDFTSFKSLLSLCDVCVKRIELRKKREAERVNPENGRVKDYESRRQAYHLLKHLQKISKAWNGGKEPPPRFARIWTLEKRLKRSQFYSRKNGKWIQNEIACAGIKALTAGGEEADLILFADDFFERWEACRCVYLLAKKFLYSPGAVDSDAYSFLGGASFVYRASMTLSQRDPGGDAALASKLFGTVESWSTGCPQAALEMPVRTDPEFEAAEPLLKALFCQLTPAQELQLLCACLASTLYRTFRDGDNKPPPTLAGEGIEVEMGRRGKEKTGLAPGAVFGEKRSSVLKLLRPLVLIWKAAYLIRQIAPSTPVRPAPPRPTRTPPSLTL